MQSLSVTLIAQPISGYTQIWLKDGMSAGSYVSKVFKVARSYMVIANPRGCIDTVNNSVVVVINLLPTAMLSASTPSNFYVG